MAKQIEGVYDAVLACAKQEFLEKGYQEASLRTIAQKAGTSTSSIYTRFHDKEHLFEAIVQPAVDDLMDRFCRIQEGFHRLDAASQKAQVNQYSFDQMENVLDDLYSRFDEFCLLLDASYGTRFQNFVDELTRIEVAYTHKYMEAVGCPGLLDGSVTEDLLHIVTTAFFEGVFEVVRHRMDRETAGRYIRQLELYHAAGFQAIFGKF